jgi:hypothetical protein
LSDKFVIVLILAAVIVLCWPVWALSHFPTQDGPAHLNIASILAWYNESPALRQCFSIHLNPAGNLLADGICAMLIRLFDPMLVERIMWTLYFVSWPVGTWFAVRLLTPRPLAVTLWSMPFASNLFVHLGFSNFCYAAVFSFFGIGVYLRSQQQRAKRLFLLFFALGGLTYLSHIAAFLGLFAITIALASAEALDLHRRRVQGVRWFAPLAFVTGALAPWLLCFTPWLFTSGTSTQITYVRSLTTRLRTVFGLTFAAAYGDWETPWLVLVVACFVALFILAIATRRSTRSIHKTDVLLIVGLAFVGACMVFPDSIGDGAYLLIRFAFSAWLCAFLWLAAQDWGPRTAAVACLTSMALIGAEVGLRYPAYIRWAQRIEEFDKIAVHVPPNVAYRSYYIDEPIMRISPTKHAADLLSLRPALNLSLYAATASHFAVRYRQDPETYKADYVLIVSPPSLDGAFLRNTRRSDWPESYELVEISETGSLRLYRRRSR